MQGRRARRRQHRLQAASSTVHAHHAHCPAFELLEERRLLAGMPELLKDINATNDGSDPNYIGVINGAMYFATDTGELWKTDGSIAGTQFVRDVSLAEEFRTNSAGVELNGRLYFFTLDFSSLETRVSRLWETDGTAAGTVEVLSIPFSEDAVPLQLTATTDALYFLSSDGVSGRELWISDGTAAGTHMVKDIAPGPASSSIGPLAAVGDMLFLQANDGTHGAELWRSDGTEAGTQLVADARVGATGTSPQYLTNVDGKLLYVASSESGYEQLIWTSDGTEAGTHSVAPVAVNEYAGAPIAFKGELYFAGEDKELGSGLWKTNGTVEGTILVKDLMPGSNVPPRFFAEFDGLLYFQAAGDQLWRTDGTEQGTEFVADGYQGNDWRNPQSLPVPWGEAGGKMLFLADDGVHGPELWRVDDTGVSLVKDVQRNEGRYDRIVGFPHELNGLQFFAVNDGTHGAELWRTDSTEEGTFLLRDLGTTPTPSSSNAQRFVEVGEITFFLAEDAEHGLELWRTDGTSAGTMFVKDVTPGARGSYIDGMANVGGTLLFTVDYEKPDESYATALWKSDGTNLGTVLVHDFESRVSSPWLEDAGVVNGVIYFRGWDDTSGFELWRSDGTTEGTWQVAEVASGVASSSPSRLTNVGGTLYFAANDGSGIDLWKSDGTAAGTGRVKDLTLNSSSASIYEIVAAEDRLYFFRSVPSSFGIELWTSDGSEEGTSKVTYALSTDAAAIGDRLVFDGVQRATEPFQITDGTLEGTYTLRIGDVEELTNVNGTLYFASSGLWKTDGTAAGTVLVKDGSAGGVRPSYLRNVNGTLYFQSRDALWKSDGTEAGTVVVDDSLQVDNLYAVGDTLYIINRDPVIGTEPWVLHTSSQTQVTGRYLFYNDSAFDGGDAAAGAADDGAIAPDKSAYLPGSGLSTTASVSSYVHGINGLMIDIAGLDGELTADDFIFRVGATDAPETWELAPAPLEIVVRAGAGAGGSDRVTLTWANGAIRNTWLQVIVKGNDELGGFHTNTGLAESDVFFFGSRVGDTFAEATALATTTSLRDELGVRGNHGLHQSVSSLFDFDRDGVVSIADQLIARNNFGILGMLDVGNESVGLLVMNESAVASPSASVPTSAQRSALAFALAVTDWDVAESEDSLAPGRRGRRR